MTMTPPPSTPPTPMTPDAPTAAPPRSWWSRNWKWVVPVGCLTPLIVCGGLVGIILAVVFGSIKSSTPYQDAVAAATNDGRVIAALGTPIEPGLLPTGSINVSGTTGDADLAIPLSGPDGSATVYATATRSAGEWVFTTLEVQIESRAERIDLLAAE